MGKQYVLHVCLCLRALARVRAFVGVPGRVGMCKRVALIIQHSTRMRHFVPSFAAPLPAPYFSTLSHKWLNFLRDVIGHKMYVLIFSTTHV
jgi:hypothetical protein